MTREEALQEIKSWDFLEGKEIEAIHTLIPELNESENERIIRAIIDALYSHTNSINLLSSRGYQMGDVEDWLEKQKECLADNSKISASEDEMIIETLYDYVKNRNWRINGPTQGEVLAWLEKQKEHHFTKRNALFDKCVENCDPIVMKKVSDEVDEMLEKEQKPAEWSEDSVKYEEGFKAGRESGLRDGQKYVLNNLDSYGLCKPAEWSDEDEKKITFLERLIRYNVPEGEYGWADGHKGGFITKSEAISKLKSLRPSWKPSEH